LVAAPAVPFARIALRARLCDEHARLNLAVEEILVVDDLRDLGIIPQLDCRASPDQGQHERRPGTVEHAGPHRIDATTAPCKLSRQSAWAAGHASRVHAAAPSRAIDRTSFSLVTRNRFSSTFRGSRHHPLERSMLT